MRNTDPFVWFRQHSDAVFRWLGVVGLVVLVFVLLRLWAMRWGGWGTWAARLRREFALTAAAFAAPVRSWRAHRRTLRLLTRRLRDPATWRDAERALAAADGAGGRPYAVLVGAGSVAVLLAGPDAPGPWTAGRAGLPTVTVRPGGTRPVVVALGAQQHAGEPMCVFLDLAAGPPVLCVDGDDRASRALLQALSAQLDVRLPRGHVTVAEGVHRDHPGPPVRTAYRTARDTPRRFGVTPVLVATGLPDPLPPELAEPPGEDPVLRVLVLGEARGYTRRLLTDRYGRVAVTGTPLLPRCDALGRAVARALDALPPVLPPAPSARSAAADLVEDSDLVETEEETAAAERARPVPEPAGVAGAPAASAAPSLPRRSEPAPATERTAT